MNDIISELLSLIFTHCSFWQCLSHNDHFPSKRGLVD